MATSIEWNSYAYAALSIVVILFVLDWIAELLNLSALSSAPPAELSDIYEPAAYAKSQAYTRANTWLGLVDSTTGLLVFLAFWWLGGFTALDTWARSWTSSSLTAGLLFIGGLYVLSYLRGLPFELLDTFWIEEKFGFNRTTWATYWSDRLKGLVLTALLGLPLLAALLIFFERSPRQGWWIAWLTISSVSLLLSYLAPRYIMPWFNKFEALQDGELKQRIDQLAADCQFPLKEIWVMDGSRRSSKSNAFFTGFGKNKRIALFDTLINNHTRDELMAVLAHEIGHYKKHHIQQQMVLGILQVGLVCFLLGQTIGNRELTSAFGIAEPSVYACLTFFSILFKPVSRLLQIGLALWSRRNEYEADHFAARVIGSPRPLIEALRKLSRDNLANLTPHPFYVFMHYSHPPLRQRITALQKA